MKNISGFQLANVPQNKIMFVVTSPDDYSMQRHILAEDWPDFGDMTVIEGSHCSCYGFEDTSWSAMTFTTEELRKVFLKWVDSYGTERQLAIAWLMSGRGL